MNDPNKVFKVSVRVDEKFVVDDDLEIVRDDITGDRIVCYANKITVTEHFGNGTRTFTRTIDSENAEKLRKSLGG